MTAQAERIIRFAEDVLGYRLAAWQKQTIRNGPGVMTLRRGRGRQPQPSGGRGSRPGPVTIDEFRAAGRVHLVWVHPVSPRPLIHKGRKP